MDVQTAGEFNGPVKHFPKQLCLWTFNKKVLHKLSYILAEIFSICHPSFLLQAHLYRITLNP